MSTGTHYTRLFFPFACLPLLLAPLICIAQSAQQLLVLPEFSYQHQAPDASGKNKGDYRASIDLLYALDTGPYRFFGEFITTDDNSTLARLHVGYETRSGTTFWLGRFQMIEGYWNKTFHYRNYIQPSIQQPGIASYEDEGGVLASHFSGLRLRQRWQLRNASALQLEAGFGVGVKFGGKRLEAYDLLDPDGGRKPSTSLRLSYQPEPETDTEFGIFFTDSRIPMKQSLFTQNNQRVIGGYGNARFGALRLYGALHWVNNDLKAPSANRRDNTVYNLWVQGDYHLNTNWMPYLRFEHSNAGHSDSYVSLFPNFVRNRRLVGLRWDFLDNQAIKFEYANTDFLRENSDQWAAQWSMILP